MNHRLKSVIYSACQSSNHSSLIQQQIEQVEFELMECVQAACVYGWIRYNISIWPSLTVVWNVLYISDDCGDDWPVDSNIRDRIQANYCYLMDSINTSRLLSQMLRESCFSTYHLQSIEIRSTELEKNQQFLHILLRRSVANFKSFIRCLMNTNQESIAEVLQHDGGDIFLEF